MAKLLKYAGNITVDQQEFPIDATEVVAGRIVTFATASTSGGVRLAEANDALNKVAGMCEGVISAVDGTNPVTRAIVRPLLPGAQIELAFSGSTPKIGTWVSVAAGGNGGIVQASTNAAIGRVIEVKTATLVVVQIQ